MPERTGLFAATSMRKWVTLSYLHKALPLGKRKILSTRRRKSQRALQIKMDMLQTNGKNTEWCILTCKWVDQKLWYHSEERHQRKQQAPPSRPGGSSPGWTQNHQFFRENVTSAAILHIHTQERTPPPPVKGCSFCNSVRRSLCPLR